MKRMKHSCLWIILSFAIFCAACQSERGTALKSWMETRDKVKVLSTTAIVENLVAKVGGERIVSLPLIVGEIDPHSYELVKGDAEKLEFADLIFYNGLGLEHGASLHAALKRHYNAVSLGDALCKTRANDLILVDHQFDPHIWMDAALFSGAVPAIVEALSQCDPEGKAYYEMRGEEVKRELLALDQEVERLIHSLPSQKRYLVTSHDAFNYFAKRYLSEGGEDWKVRFMAPEGLSPDGQLSPQHIQEIIDHLKRYEISVIFPESNVSRDSIKKIVSSGQRAGLTIHIAKEPLYGDALGGADSGAESYFDMLKFNAELIVRTLNHYE